MHNSVTLIGNLGSDPEISKLPTSGSVANMSVATTMRWKDKQTGEKKEQVEWHRVVAFNRLADVIGDYLKKGSQVFIEGRLQTRMYEKDGIKRYSTEIVCSKMNMLGVKSSGGGDVKAQQQAEAYQPHNNNEAPVDGDIPF